MSSQRISWSALSEEPFRLFFALAVLVGIGGVALWPLYFGGLVGFYPGQSHARLMSYGFFGGFMLGFLGTAMPRMLSARPLRPLEVGLLLVLYLAAVGVLFAGRIVLGDALFIALLTALGGILAVRIVKRGDLPPPGFVLVGLGLLCAWFGAAISIAQSQSETGFFWGALQHLLSFQGFILLPILGVGAFLMPRFFGAESEHNFPESVRPPAGWTGKVAAALSAGVLLVISFWMEAAGWFRAGPALRFAVTLVYLAREVPFYRRAQAPNTVGAWLRAALLLLLAGFLAIVFLPAYRIAVLHLTLVGGFAVVTFVVAARVIYGHSGNMPRLAARNRWLSLAASLMLLAMVTRISGDFWPKVLASHYSYGAVVWILGVLIWSVVVLPKVLAAEVEK